MRIAYATCAELPEPDPDESPLIDALRDAGHDAELLAWDSGADASGYDLCLIRATWNYPWKLDAFGAWLDRTERQTALWNPAPAVRWNLDKQYLLELETAGVPIVPTARVEQGASSDVRALATERGWESVVVKPAVSAGSYETRCFGANEFDDADAFLRDSLAQRHTLVQRYMPEVERGGERALVWIDAELTHVIVKQPRFDDDEESVALGPAPTDEERAFAERAIRLAGFDLLYARVDVIATDQGLLLSELELIEPSLFFPQYPPALDRFVAGVERIATESTAG